MNVLAAAAGAALVAGVLLLTLGIRGSTESQTAAPGRAGLMLERLRAVPPMPLVAAAGTGVGVLAVTGWPVAAVGGAAGAIAVPRLMRSRPARRHIARLEALSEWTRRVADILTSGAGGLEQAIAMSTRTAPPPIAPDVAALAARCRVRGVEAALYAFADDLADPAGDLVTASLILRARAGGRGLTTVLEGLATSLAEEVAARRRVEADRAKPRTNMRTIIGVTIVVLAGLIVFARGFLAPFGTGQGQLVLALICGQFAAALWWMARLARPITGFRFLAPPAQRRTSPLLRVGR